MDARPGIGTMDKDVKRALLLWPTLASTALVAATSLPLYWDAPWKASTLRQVAAESSALARVVSTARQLLGSAGDRPPAVVQSVTIDLAKLSDRFRLGSLDDAAPEHRPDRGLRGLATPVRLAVASLDSSAGIEGAHDEKERSSEGADLGSSTQVIAQTLLAPVLDPVAELAGYSGRENIPTARPVLPSILSPGMDDPYAATGNTSPPLATDRTPTGDWMSRLNPIVDSVATVSSDSHYATAAHRGDSSPASIDMFVPKPSGQAAAMDAASDRPDQTIDHQQTTQVKRSLGPRANMENLVTWPRPNQLREELSAITTDADDLVVRLGPGADRMLTSTASPASGVGASSLTPRAKEMLDDLVDQSSAHRRSDSADAAVQRQAAMLAMGKWAMQVDHALDELRSLPRIDDERSGDRIGDLAKLSETGLQLAERVPARDQQIRWLRASHALARRAAVWGPIWQLARLSGDENDSPARQAATSVPGVERTHHPSAYSLAHFQNDDHEIQVPGSADEVAMLTAAVRRDLRETGDAAGWTAFLLLDELDAAAMQDDADERALLAQRFLSRLKHYSLQSEHRQWLQRGSVDALADELRSWTVRPIDYARLLSDLERGETDSIDLAAIKVSEAFQTLRFTESAEAARVADAIDVTYRNANVRTAISVDLINRFLPTLPARTEPIRTTVLGNDVRGVSTVKSDLSVQLQPSADSWQLTLGTDGDVATRSQSGQSGVSVLSSGHNTFHAQTPLIIRPKGYQVGETFVSVTGQQHLSGIRSPYDRWPLIGSLVHGIAESRFENALPVAKQISGDRIRREVTTELQTQLTQKARGAETQLDELVLGPLGRLNLDPQVIDLETTPRRLVARYRLAGDWQLASHTPRPRAWSDSWMSVQIHQSALNNTLERLLPTGQAKSIQEFYTDTMNLFGQNAKALPDDVPGDAMIEFASTRPITVEIDDGKVWITLRIVRLSEPDGAALTRFIVRAGYQPKVNGLESHLVRDGHLSIRGPGMTMGQRIAVRALFNKILSEQRPIPLTGPRVIAHPAMRGLAVSQLELRDGWLALAISPETSPRVATASGSDFQ